MRGTVEAVQVCGGEATRVLIGIAVAAVLVAVFLLIPWFAGRMQDLASDSSGSGVFGVFEEVFHPAAHRTQVIQQEQDEQGTPTPTPDDPPPGGPSELGPFELGPR